MEYIGSQIVGFAGVKQIEDRMGQNRNQAFACIRQIERMFTDSVEESQGH